MSYDHIKIENKWQSYWFEKKIFSTEVDPKKPKYYVSNKGNRMSASVKSNLTKKLGWRAKISLESYLKKNYQPDLIFKKI